jgi:hypothetical protein
VHGDLQILKYFLGFRDVVIRPPAAANSTERAVLIESVPFSCRLVDATSGNKQQLQ